MDYTVLINKSNPIDKNLEIDLVHVISSVKDNILLEKRVNDNFCHLQKYLLNKNINIQVYSGYRTHEYQTKLYEDIKEKKGSDYANKYVAKPYHSEHETGLALDFAIYEENAIYEEHDIKDYKNLGLIHDSLHKFGFILRYPLGKENITKYNYEPWHIRYVGEYLAKEIYEEKITLEEYYLMY